MSHLQFSDEEFNAVLHKAQIFYSGIGHIRCPYFREPVHFSPYGMEHLRRKSWNRGRSRNDQFMRLKFIAAAPEILRSSHTLQGVCRTQERVRRHRHGRWEEVFKPIVFYEFIAVLQARRFKIIVKETETGGKMFWSIIPFWGRSEQGSRVLHDGDPTAD